MSVWSKACSVSGGKKVWKNYIAGKWVGSSSKATFDVLDPANGRIIGRVPKSTKDDAERAIQAAWDNRSVMANMPMIERDTKQALNIGINAIILPVGMVKTDFMLRIRKIVMGNARALRSCT